MMYLVTRPGSDIFLDNNFVFPRNTFAVPPNSFAFPPNNFCVPSLAKLTMLVADVIYVCDCYVCMKAKEEEREGD